MKAIAILCALIMCLLAVEARADSLVASVQQTLKDEGFYYGEITGQKDADTIAAIRRFQIRHGLKITGEINVETQKALGKTVAPAPRPTPPRQMARATPLPLRGPLPRVQTQPVITAAPASAPGASDPAIESNGLFAGAPYETASPNLQQRVLDGAQKLLVKGGYFRGTGNTGYDSIEFAIRAYQARFGLAVNGKLDRPTLGALGLLPGQRAPGVTATLRRGLRREQRQPPRGEQVYEPR